MLKTPGNRTLLGVVLLSNILVSAALPQSSSGTLQPAAGTSGAAKVTPVSAATTAHRYQPTHFPKRAQLYYQLDWGVDELTVRSVESGELIRFNFRVLDPVRAQPLNDKKSEPFLIDERARVKLVVPSLEKVGQLRQSATPEAGKTYWMAFSNKGGLVKRGDRVSVVIGKFRADGLVVQ